MLYIAGREPPMMEHRILHLEGGGDALQVDGLCGAAFPAAGVLLELAAADALCLYNSAWAALLALACYLPLIGEHACMRTIYRLQEFGGSQTIS